MAKRTTINRPLLLETLARIEAHPENWDQSEWAKIYPTKDWHPDNLCGTSFCFAGHALVQEGYAPFISANAVGTALDSEYRVADFVKVKDIKKVNKGKLSFREMETFDAEDTATEKLGLTVAQAVELFDGSNSIERIRELVARFLTISDACQTENFKAELKHNKVF